MDSLTTAAAAGMRARLESLDLLANNISNAATAGYKADREFYSTYVSAEAAQAAADSRADALTMPVIEKNWTDHAQGVVAMTGNPLDLALSGKGFFSVEGPSGPLYTRDGGFRLSPQGVVESRSGYPLRAEGGGRIRAEPGLPLEFKPDGSVVQSGQALGRIELAAVKDPESLAKEGGNYFRLVDPAGLTKASAQVVQGGLEGSNAGPAESAVRLVSVLRQFEMLQRAVTMGSEMNRKAVEEVARP
jgi:flagellar basal body rod protein FlgG